MVEKMTLADQAESALRAVREAPEIGFDTETSGLDWKRNNPVGYVITVDPNNNWYIPIRHGGGANLSDSGKHHALTEADGPVKQHEFEKDLAKAFSARQGRTVGHHLKFDMMMSTNMGITINDNNVCSQINAALLDEYAKSFSLENSCNIAKVTAKKGQVMYDRLAEVLGVPSRQSSMSEFWRLPGNDPVAVEYAIGDGISTLELNQWQQPQLEEQGLQVVRDLEYKLQRHLNAIQRRGIKIDVERLHQLLARVQELGNEARQLLPTEDFNVRSGAQVRGWMEKIGRLNWPTTDKGNPSFTEKWLKTFPEGQAVVAVRQYFDLISKFISPLIDNHVFNGRVHAQLNQLKNDEYGTISGRFSCSDPNLQAFTKRLKELGRMIRSVFIADEGMELFEADYSQCEPRLFAHYSEEPSLIDGYNANPPRDMHQIVANMLGVERDPTAKRMNMGILTGMQARSFADHMDWPLPRAQASFNEWMVAFPGIRDFQDLAKTVIRSRGYVKTLLGRRCRMDHPRFAYRATSKIIQGGNADIIKYMLLKWCEYLEEYKLEEQLNVLMTIHDSFLGQRIPGVLNFGDSTLDALIKIALDVQSAPFNLKVPFKMDVGSGANWAIATYGDDQWL